MRRRTKAAPAASSRMDLPRVVILTLDLFPVRLINGGCPEPQKYGCGWFRGNPPKAILRRHTKVLTYSSSGYRVLQTKTFSGWVKNVQTCWSSRSQKCIKTRNSGSEVVLKESPRERQAKPKREGPFFLMEKYRSGFASFQIGAFQLVSEWNPFGFPIPSFRNLPMEI